jgi:putative ABC transport system permease protein
MLRLTVATYGQGTELDVQVAGYFDLFPGWLPEEGPLFVGNLDQLFAAAGGQYPYYVWLSLSGDADHVGVREEIEARGIAPRKWRVSAVEVTKETQRPERQGLLGLLSVGFLAAAVLTVTGFLLYGIFSFRSRSIELGVLRAIGLSMGQMTSFLACELAFLILIGLSAGTALGLGVSDLFIPHLQVGASPADMIPPFAVILAWPLIYRIYALFGLLFLVALGSLVAVLARQRIFEAVKLGEVA